jgi:hypothetical protein
MPPVRVGQRLTMPFVIAYFLNKQGTIKEFVAFAVGEATVVDSKSSLVKGTLVE